MERIVVAVAVAVTLSVPAFAGEECKDHKDCPTIWASQVLMSPAGDKK